MPKKIGECLIQSGLISEQDLQVALQEHRRTGERVGAVLVRLNFVTEKQVTKALAYQLGLPFVSLSDDPPERSTIVLIPREVAVERTCIAVGLESGLLTVAMSDPLLLSLVQDLECQTGYRIKPVVATRSDILGAIASGYPDKAIARYAGAEATAVVAVQVPVPAVRHDPSAPPDVAVSTLVVCSDDVTEGMVVNPGREFTETIALADMLVKGAITSGATDVHIEPTEHAVLVRHRFDGLLKEVMDLPRWTHEGLVARLKRLSGLDVDETRLPQDGRLRISTGDGAEADLRVSTLRTLFGEKILLRPLDHHKAVVPLEELGFSAAAMETVRDFIRRQHGLILVVGPTGSGRTTTLSAAVSSLRSGQTNIITIEDPIEYEIAGVNQAQVDDQVNLTFSSALRAVLRHDADVLLVGEIRDQETANLALRAAQTGQLVLAGLHADDAASAVSRLVEMPIEPHVIGSALVGVVAQRLVRRLCLACRRPYTPEADRLRALAISEADAAQFVLYKAVGCGECNYTGYRGRIALYEIMRVTDAMRRLIAAKAEEDLIRDAAVEAGMVSLGEDGLVKVKAGVTTDEELLRVLTHVREMRTRCPACSGAVATDFQVCPHCGHRLGHGCPKCSRALQADWSFCPYCSSNAVSKRKKKLKERKALEDPRSNVAEFKNQNR